VLAYSGDVVFSLIKGDRIRADVLLSSILDISRTRVQRNILNENFILNGQKIIKNSYNRFFKKDLIEFEVDPLEEVSVDPEKIDLEIIFENDFFLVVNKPAGLVVHPGAGHSSGTLINGILYHLSLTDNVRGLLRAGLVHRIDKDTSGLLVVAKTPDSFEELANMFSQHDIDREYLCLAGGKLRKKKGVIATFHGRDPKNRLRFSPDVRNGRRAVTHYEVTDELPFASVVSLKLETGRTHQIRMHMKHLGHPIVNDTLYGGTTKTSDKCLNVLLSKSGRQLLHAGVLGFKVFGTEYCFKVELPSDMRVIMDYLISL